MFEIFDYTNMAEMTNQFLQFLICLEFFGVFVRWIDRR